MSRRTRWFHKILDFFAKSMSEPYGGGPSAMRFAAFLVVSNVMICWTYIVISDGKWQSMGWDMIVFVLSVLGVKAWQRGKEAKPTSTPRGEDDA